MTKESKRKAKFIELVNALKTRPKVRPFGNNEERQAQHDREIAFARAEIEKPEMVMLLGEDYATVKANVEALA